MLKKVLNVFKNLDKMTCKIMKHGLRFCTIIAIIAVFVLFTYDFTFPSPFIYYIGINLLRLSLIFGIEFIICGFVVDGIKKQLI